MIAKKLSPHRLNEPVLDENPTLLYTLAYCELIEELTDTLFPPNITTKGAGSELPTVASSARVDRYIHCRAAWEPAFGLKVQLALRDLSAVAKLVYKKTFANLEISKRNDLLATLKAGEFAPEFWPSSRSQPEAFETIHDAIAAGVFADPGYGGNANGIGWQYAQFTV